MIDRESILTSIKKDLGIDEAYEDFDPDILMYINTTFPILAQLGVETAEGYLIDSSAAKWSDHLINDSRLEFIKTFIYLKVKLIFDPPASGTILDAYNKMISELEFRITVAVDEIKKERCVNE